ncbi:ankyrin repeat-containing protein NPR4-like [Solanum stenotomum]|uniref:ankyrin repeat-containing protein NPR4-like n=1 Tax=Solanum stenotomum TaxID=172797 RepID=UPI0020D06A34|nr:ankyrin repeat-containing protein NPR4-like [Solanum stenotomum]
MESQLSHDNEQLGSRDIENQFPNPPPSVDRILVNAALRDNWRPAVAILKKEPRFVSLKTEEGVSLFFVALEARSIRFVREVMKLMEVGDLEQKDNNGNTAFYHAAYAGLVEIAKEMVEKNKNLPNIRSQDEELPITVAASIGHKDMVSYLFEVTNFDLLQQQERLNLLHSTIQSEMYEVALKIFNKDRKLAAKMLEDGNINVLQTLSQKSIAISNASSPVWRKFISVGRRQSISLLKLLPERYVVEKQAETLLEELWAECQRSGADKLIDLVEKEKLAHSAAKAGNLGFLLVVTRDHPGLICKPDDKSHTMLHDAVLYREEKVFSLIHQIGALKKLIIAMVDNDDNNILHLAGKLGEPQKNVQSNAVKEGEKIMPPSFLRVSGAALQMQREILWFKEVEKLVPPSVRKRRNKDGKTPRELFTEEHKLLLKDGEKWMKDTANSCMIVATLIATMVFAAGFTVPGGYNSDNGIPILLKLYGFRIFVISDAVALFSSIISIIMFLSILTRYAEDDFLVSLPAKLLFGLTALFVSIVSMLVAFTATFILNYRKHTGWEPKLIVACAGVPVALFGCLQYKLWFDVAKSTYWSKFLFRSGKHKRD